MFEILKRAGVDYTERRLLYKPYKMETAVKKIGETEKKACIIRRVRQGCTISPSKFNTHKNICFFKNLLFIIIIGYLEKIRNCYGNET